MKHLLDVNVLLAAIWAKHSHHSRAFDWLTNKTVISCPLAELGFIRISSNKRASINVSMDDARAALARFLRERSVQRVKDDLAPLESHPKTSDEVTGQYLADLATKHSAKLATFDEGLKHSAAELIPELEQPAG